MFGDQRYGSHGIQIGGKGSMDLDVANINPNK
jgi:hypothetical protein